METLETLTRRMTTLGSIRNVVRAMKTLSAVNALPYDHAAVSIARYHEAVLRGLQAFLHQADVQSQSTPSIAKRIVLVFGSDHGLCGGYNEVIADAAIAAVKTDAATFYAVGARMANALEARVVPFEKCFTPPASAEGLGRFASEVLIALDEAQAGEAGGSVAVTSVHMASGSRGSHAPLVQEFLPLSVEFLETLRKRPWRSTSLPMAGMEREALFSALVRNHLFASLVRVSAEAMAAENAARLALMQQAERSIEERISELLSTTRSARQSEITSELLDVISGFEALRQTRPAVR